MRTLSAFGQICLVMTGVFASAACLGAMAQEPVIGSVALVAGAFTFAMSFVDATMSRGRG